MILHRQRLIQECSDRFQRPGRDKLRKPTAQHDLIESLCWCEADTVKVWPDAVRAGQTIACDRPECHPPGWLPAERIAS